MCTGTEILIASALATGAGQIMQSRAVDDARDRQAALNAQTEAANDRLARESASRAADSQELYDPGNIDIAADNEAAAAQARYQAATQNLSNMPMPGVGALDTPETIGDIFAQEKAGAYSRGIDRADAASKLTGMGQAFVNAGVGSSKNANDIRMLSGFQQGNAEALNRDLSEVEPGNGLLFGQLLSGVGQAGLTAGLSAPATSGIKPVTTTTMKNATSGLGDFFVPSWTMGAV